jgi:hypothetical protein
MLPLYLGSLALGTVLIGASFLFGDADTDADVDFVVDGDLDLDVDGGVFGGGLDIDNDALLIMKDPGDAIAGAGTWLPFLSLRFWTFALASFGLSGTLLHLLGVPVIIGAIASVVMGTGLGTAAAWTFRQLQLTQVSGNVGMFDVPGKDATVLLAVGPNKMGKVRVMLDGQSVDLPAMTRAEDQIERNEKALVVNVDDGVAHITPVPFGYNSMAKEN